ncbi:serine hydrolase domain-containing protein [Enterococcus sp. AZ109]|uniref:serine hydrolase domain-containing protein n=1 Tax=Enterococcus sp. AZ109 TaxID=2774634 RepID=UPI003F26891D
MTTKHKRFLLLVLIIGLILSALAMIRSSTTKNGTFTSLKEYTDFTMDSIPIQNMAIAVTEDNEVTYSNQYGEGINEQSNFIIGSASKSFTGLAIKQLIDQNRLQLTDSASTYLPTRGLPEEIKVLDLLNHTSGIAANEKVDVPAFTGVFGKFEYANTNYNLLGEIIEVVTGEPFAEYMRNSVFPSLNMRNSFALTYQTETDIVQGYNSFYGIPIAINPSIPKSNSFIQAPSGYLCSNSDDLTKYLNSRLSSDDLLEQVKQYGVKVTSDPALEGMFQNDGTYGFGWIYKTINGTDILYHTGKTPTFNSLLVLIPEKNIGISILYSYGDFLVGTPMMEEVNESIVALMLGKSVTVTKKTPSSYTAKHLFINVLLVMFALFCTFISLRKYNSKAKPNSLFFLVLQLLLAGILILLFKLMGLSLDVLWEFIPDVIIIIVYCLFVLLLSGGRNIYLCLFKRTE